MKLRLIATVGLPIAFALMAGIYWLSETRRLGAHLRALEADNERLERELGGALAQRDAINAFLRERTTEILSEEAEDRARLREALRPMPEGVRLALAAMNELLADDGYAGIRLLAARAIEERALVGVELLEQDPVTLHRRVHLADRVTLHLDRTSGELLLRLLGGHRWVDGAREAYPAEGWPIALLEVEGPRWESRLGYLLDATGAYPEPEPRVRPQDRLDRHVRAAWIDRLNRLLDRAGTELRYRVDHLEGLGDGTFLRVLLLGFERGKTLAVAYEVARMSVIADARAPTVELLLEDGVLRKAGGEATIGAGGYRILLPGLSRDDAMGAMMGMVVSR